jgi:hypothetical protein
VAPIMRFKHVVAFFLMVLAVSQPLWAQVEKAVADAEGIT